MVKKRILITRTEKEWEDILEKLPPDKKKCLATYIRQETTKLIKECNENSIKSGSRIKRAFIIQEHQYLKLVIIAKKLNKPVSALVDERIIVPLLYK